MNYRHAYHAGNFADVFKHVVLMLCLEHLARKDKPFFVLDTHAGIGRYDIEADQARKTGEAMGGIGRLWGQDASLPEILQRYLGLVQGFNRGRALRLYPGSPLIINEMLRPDDRMVANELHPEDVYELRHVLAEYRQARVEQMDGYLALKSFLPPAERRGLVLVDPPFEMRDEFDQMLEGLKQAHRRWATGVYALWYPIKDVTQMSDFHQALKDSSIPDIVALDFYLHAANDPFRLNGCGLAMINPPWTLAQDIRDIAPNLVQRLTQEQGRIDVTVIAAES